MVYHMFYLMFVIIYVLHQSMSHLLISIELIKDILTSIAPIRNMPTFIVAPMTKFSGILFAYAMHLNYLPLLMIKTSD